MSTSRTNRFINEINLPLLSYAQLVAFEKNEKKSVLRADEKLALEKLFYPHTAISKIAELITQFNEIKNNMAALAGLTEKQIAKLKKLVTRRKFYKEANAQGTLEIPDYKKFIANEKEIVPLDHKIQWWTTNADAYK